MSAAVAHPTTVLPMKRARAMPRVAAINGAHDDTHPDFTLEMAKMLSAYVVAHGELPCTESIPAPVVHAKIGGLPTRNLLDVGSLLGAHTVSQDIPLMYAGMSLHLEATIDPGNLSFSAHVRIDHIPIFKSAKIADCNVGAPGNRCEFGYKGILHAALYIEGRTLKLHLEVVGNSSTIDIITV